MAYTNAVLYPAQQTAVGAAVATESNGVYTLSNNVLAASYVKMGEALYFGGSEAMDLVAGTEPFTVAFGNGDNVPASAMTLTSLGLEDLTANANAIGGAEHYAGKALVANYEYIYNDSKIEIVWRAVLRDGSHYLRTEMELTGVDDVDMYNIIPMIYNVDTKAAGSTPATVGNTRGKVIMSNKIFAGLETPTAYNTVGGATGEEDNWNLVATPVTETLEASAWTAVDIANVPMRIQEVGGSNRTYCTYSKTITLKKDQKVTTTLTYKSGSKRFDIDGTVLLDGNGAIAASDYHHGYSGTAKENNIYSFIAPNDGEFTVCMYIDKREGDIVSTSEFKVEVYEAKEGVVVNSDIVGIQGRWSRNTTLPQGETWKVGAVVGLIAQDGTQANTDIHTTQKRRSFLAYSERERAVPWRAVPAYVAWYELQINRNNAAPGREHLDNTKADDVLDVMSHWKSDFYDRYGIAPSMFVIDDGWDLYGEWTFHSAFPNELRDMASAAKEMDGAGIGAWLGPVGGYGQSGTYRRQYWIDKGQKMELSNPEYYAAFKKAAHNLVVNQGDNYTFFKFDGISGQFSSVGPDAGDVGNENAEGIIRLERYVREELREDIFFNTTVGTWASPFWYQISDATWRQENDYDEIGNNSLKRENWITYRDNLVHQNYVDASPICPINTLMTHGFILTKFGPPAGANRDYESVRRELRAAFLCGSGIVELYNDYDLMNSINGGALWADIAECIAWQKRNADVLPDIHWVGGDPWTGSKAEVYGWAAWNGTKSTLALRNGANDAQTYTFTLRQALNIPKNVNGSIILRSAFGDQAALTGLTEGTAINIDTELTVTLPGSSIYAFEGIDATAEKNNVSSITLTVENEATEVTVGNTLVLRAAANADATFPAIAWTSSNPEVATVVGGLVQPKKAGEVTITATAKDGSGVAESVTLTINPSPIVPPFSTEEAPEYWWIQFCTGGATLADQGAGVNVQTATKAYNNNQLWQLVGDKSGFYMKNKAGRYLSWTGTDKGDGRFQTTTDESSKATLILHNSGNAHAAEAGCYEIQRNGGSYMNQHGGSGTGKELGTWNANDANNHFVFITTAPAYPKFNDEEAWYYIKFGNGGWVIEDKGAGNKVLTTKLDDYTSMKWRVTGTKDNCQIISQDGHYMVYEDSRIKAKTTPDAQGFKLVATTNDSYPQQIEIQHRSSTTTAFNMNGGAGSDKEIGLWNANAAGNPLTFVSVESVIFPEFKMAASSATAPAEKLTLWYTQSAPATGVGNTWMEYSLPIGNGQFGASLFGGVAKDEILFNDKTLWSGGPGEYGYYLPFGSVYIEDLSGAFTFNPTKPVQNYYRDLNLKTATGTVSYEDLDGVKYTKQYIASNPDKAIVTKITASEEGKLSFRITMESGKPTVNAVTTYENGYAQFSGKLQTVSYNATLKVVAEGGTLTTADDGITVEEADEVLVILAGCTDFVGNNASHVNGRADLLGEDNKAIVDAVAQKGWNAVYADHVADHQNYFCRVDFQIDGVENDLPTNELITAYNAASGARNLMLEQLYYQYGRYLSIASSRGADSPANLQGIWNNSCTPPWHSDIHANINVQMNYWPVEAGNLSDMHEPFVNYIINEAAQPEWRSIATNKGATREDSWTLLTENNIFGGVSTFAPDALINNAWYVTHLWQHYRYTLDEEYLLRAFPAMKGASLFWVDRMVLADDGTYECPNEYSPEHGPGAENATAHAQQIVRECLSNTIKAADVLDAVAKGLISETDYNDLVDRYTNMDDGLEIEQYEEHSETGWPAERNGIKVGDNILREWKYSRFYVSSDKGHRHMSHLMSLFPFGQLTQADTELFPAAINSMILRGDESTGWSMGWKINLWARALRADRAHAVLRKALKHSTSYGTNQAAGGIYYNLFDSHAPFQIDGNFGAASGVQEMLMQSHTEVIDILPALPAEWSKGSIKGLKAVGDFTVDIVWEGNQARKVVITNNQGQPCYVKCVGLEAAAVTVDSTPYALGAATTHSGLECYQIASAAGDEIVIDLSKATQNDKSALEALIAQTNELINECYDYYATEVTLQTTTESDAYYVSTNAQEDAEGPIANLVDGSVENHFHSEYSTDKGANHYININLGSENATKSFKFKYATRKAETNFPKTIVISGSNDGESLVDIATVTDLPVGNSSETKYYTSGIIESATAYTQLRFTVTANNSGNKEAGNHPFFHMAEFDLMPRTTEPVETYPDAELVPAAVEAAKTAVATAEQALAATQTTEEYAASLAALQAKYDALVAAIANESQPEEETSVAVTISSSEIATFYANEAVTIPDGVEAYVALNKPVMEEGEGTIVMTKIADGIVPAETGAVLRGVAGDYEFNYTAEVGSTDTEGNMLVGYAGIAEYQTVGIPTGDGSTVYVLTVKDGAAGFYKKVASFKVYNNKAYLKVPAAVAGSANALRIRFADEETTGIDNSELTVQDSAVIYDLMGRKVTNPTKGVYIVNGKKVIR